MLRTFPGDKLHMPQTAHCQCRVHCVQCWAIRQDRPIRWAVKQMRLRQRRYPLIRRLRVLQLITHHYRLLPLQRESLQLTTGALGLQVLQRRGPERVCPALAGAKLKALCKGLTAVYLSNLEGTDSAEAPSRCPDQRCLRSAKAESSRDGSPWEVDGNVQGSSDASEDAKEDEAAEVSPIPLARPSARRALQPHAVPVQPCASKPRARQTAARNNFVRGDKKVTEDLCTSVVLILIFVFIFFSWMS